MGKNIKLQIALDVLTTEDALNLVTITYPYIDIIEIGTPLVKHEGVSVLKTLRNHFKEKEILVDLKTMDVGEYESDIFFKEGADIVTVLGAASLETVKGSVKSAKKYGGKVLVDLINVEDKVSRAIEAINIGCDYIGVHTGIDQQHKGETPFADLRLLKNKINIPIFVAGGINLHTLDKIIEEKPYTIVVGGSITLADYPANVAREMKTKLNMQKALSV